MRREFTTWNKGLSLARPRSDEWDKPLAELKEHKKTVRSVAYSPDGNLIATGGEDNKALIWHQDDGQWKPNPLIDPSIADSSSGIQASGSAKPEPQAHKGFVQTITFSHDGKYLVTASRDQTAKIWNVGTRTLEQTLTDENVVRGAVFSPDDQVIVTGNESCRPRFGSGGNRWGAGR